jgi:hypothetical protein
MLKRTTTLTSRDELSILWVLRLSWHLARRYRGSEGVDTNLPPGQLRLLRCLSLGEHVGGC